MKKIALCILLCLASSVLFAQVVVPTNGLIAYYTFDGNASDISGNGNDGILGGTSGNPVLTTDRFGASNSAYLFGGYNNENWIRIPNTPSLQLSHAFSISCWILHTDFAGMSNIYGSAGQARVDDGTEQHAIFSKGGTGYTDGGIQYSNPGMILYSSPNSRDNTNIINYNNTIGSNRNQSGNANYNCFQTNEWLHVVLVVDNENVKIFLNGSLYLTVGQPSADFTSANSQDLFIGRSQCPAGQTATFPFCGKIDDIAIYNRALTEQEVDGLFGGFHDDRTADNEILIDNILIENPCGTRMGKITFQPRPGNTYQYAIGSPNDVQASNTLNAQVGTHRFYAVSQCGLFDTLVTFVCDCSETPGSSLYDSICPGQTGSRGSIQNIYECTTDGALNTWTRNNKWEINNQESNYLDAGFYYASYRGYSGRSFFCPTYFGYFNSTTSYLTSPAITINNPARSSLSFAYLAVAMSDGYMNGYNTLTLEWSTSPSGPWTRLWSSGGGDIDPWRTYSGSLASLPSSGTYYFRFTNKGNGYVSGIDNFVVKEDNRFSIPAEVSRAAGGTTVPITETIEMEGFCDSTVTTYWYVKPNTESHLRVANPFSYTWEGRTYTESGDYQKTGLKNKMGCDSVAYLHLQISYDNFSDTTATACDKFIWYGQVFTQTDSAVRHYTNIWGGDSTVTLYVTIHPSYHIDSTSSVCEPLLWYGNYYNASGVYTRTGRTHAGCDSILKLHLTVRSDVKVDIYDSVCQNGIYSFSDTLIKEAGIYIRTFRTPLGCDSTVTLHLSITPRTNTTLEYGFDCATGYYTLWANTDARYHYWSTPTTDQNIERQLMNDTLVVRPLENLKFSYTSDFQISMPCPTSVDIELPKLTRAVAKLDVHPTYLSVEQLSLNAVDISNAADSRTWFINGEEITHSGSHYRYTATTDEDSVIISLAIVNGICTDTTSVIVPMIRTTLYIPNTFCPNLPNSINSLFGAWGEGLTHFELYVYNRQGLLVFHTTDINARWNGTYHEKPCPEGIYTYFARYKDRLTPGNWQFKKGAVSLVR